jgi:CHAT domain-containing protein
MAEGIEERCAELVGLPDESSRLTFLNRSPQLLDPAVVEELAEAVRRKLRVDLAAALRLADVAILVAGQLDNLEALGRGLRAKANALFFMGQCRPAVDLFHQAVVLFENAGKLNEVGRTLSSSIQPLIRLGEYESATAAAERAGQIFSELGETVRLARLGINVANIHHRQDHFVEALAEYERAYQLLLAHQDAEGVGVALHNMAVCRIALDDFSGALESYQKIRVFCQGQEMPLLLIQADYNIAYLYYLRGDYTQALELLRVTRENCRQNGDDYHLGLCDLDQSEIYLELQLVDEAAEMAQRGFERFKELAMNFEAARALSSLASAAGIQGDATRSLRLFAEAKEMFIREKNEAWPFVLDLRQSLILFGRGDISEARALLEPAVSFFRSAPMPGKHVISLLLMARIDLFNGHSDSAFHVCQEAQKLAVKLGFPILIFQSEFLMGQILETREEPVKAWNSYQEARSSLETLRGALGADELKIAFMKDKGKLYGRLVKLCFDRTDEGADEEAFSYIEEAKSRTLRDLVFGRTSPITPAKPVEGGDSDRVSELRKELNWFYHRIEREQLSQDGVSAESIQLLQERARGHEHELLRLSRELPSSTLGEWSSNSDTASLAEIRASLGPDTALVEYFAIEEEILAAVLTSSTLEFVSLTRTTKVAEPLRLLQFQMSKFNLGSDYVTKFREPLLLATQTHLESLYKEVFAPLIPRLESKEHLVIVPYGLLHSLPFHALFDGTEYLIDRFSVCYAPSASIHAFCTRESETAAGPSLILGVEDPNTPFVRDEVLAVAAAVPGSELLWGADATSAALREKGSRSRLVHVATHGYFRQDNPMFSAIRLADSYLSLYDLYHMNLPAELLTLSGCVTGVSMITDAEEPLGLARGLLYAGARSLLLSLWDVDDRSTADFMSLFYFHLLRKSNKAQALRDAMLDHRTRYPHPYYWAPFRLSGKVLG